MSIEEKNKIEKLEKTLYSRQSFKADDPIHDLTPKKYEVNNSWAAPEQVSQKKRLPLGKILMWFSIAFFLLALIIAGIVYYNGFNTISADNINISIIGPTTIDTGREATISVALDNQNQIDIQDTYLVVEYPDGARRSSIDSQPLVQDRIPLGNIVSGARIERPVSAVFFGLQGNQEKIKVTLEYHVLGSNNFFEKDKEFLFTLGVGPLSMTVGHVDQVNSGQDISFNVALTSNSTTILKNIALNISYPFGFTFKSAAPAASVDNSVWKIGDIAPGETKNITIVGKLDGQEDELRSFKFNAGIINPADVKQIATVFYIDTETIAIKKPFIGLDMAFNGNPAVSFPSFAGESINVSLSYGNNMSMPLADGIVTVKIDGAILDKSLLNVSQGLYQSANGTITWDRRSVPALAVLNPGDHGVLQFSIKTFPFSVGAIYAKSSQKVSIVANALATQVSPGGTTPISSSISRNVVINSNISLSAKSTYFTDIFKNTGPIPPKAEKETSYTITWSISNTFNNTSNVSVSAVLPSYVKFLNNISPQNENLTYNNVSGEINWNVGNIKTNTGNGTSPRQVSFQVSILPSLTQSGTSPVLLGASLLKATDTFTKVDLTSSAEPVSTDIFSDPQYKYGQGSVIK